MITNFSILPIHIITILGILISLISGFYAVVNIIQKLLNKDFYLNTNKTILNFQNILNLHGPLILKRCV